MVSISLLGTTLSGCLLLNPFHGQELSDRSEVIPFQAWTTKSNGTLKVECMPTNRYGPEISSYGSWAQVTTIPISTSPSLDRLSNAAYSAAKDIVLPDSCWYYNRTYSKYYTSLRVIQNDYLDQENYEYMTVDLDGGKCAVEQTYLRGLGYAPNCARSYSNSSTKVTYMTLVTQN